MLLCLLLFLIWLEQGVGIIMMIAVYFVDVFQHTFGLDENLSLCVKKQQHRMCETPNTLDTFLLYLCVALVKLHWILDPLSKCVNLSFRQERQLTDLTPYPAVLKSVIVWVWQEVTCEYCLRARVRCGLLKPLEQLSWDSTHWLHVGEQAVHIHYLQDKHILSTNNTEATPQ